MKLFPYQEEGVEWLQSHFRCILADEPGLGKTVQVAALLERCPGIKRVLIVCPANVKQVWVKHAGAIALSGTAPFPIIGKRLVINYDILTAWIKNLSAVPWDCIVFDEAHYLKSVEAKRSAAAFSKLMGANRVIFLTGTPMLSRPVELWSILYAIDRDLAGGYQEYTAQYCNGHYDKAGHWATRGASNLKELSEKLDKVMLRRLKKDVLPQLPPRVRTIVDTGSPVDLSPVLGDDWQDQIKAMAKAKKMPDQEVLAKIRKLDGVMKAPWVARYAEMRLEQKPGCKIIIAAHHKDVVEILEGFFENRCVTLTGETYKKDRELAVTRFQTDPNTRVFIGNITAAGQGITLTAADRVIFAELSWVPGEMDQMECRPHRIGQRETVWIDWVVTPGSIDSMICPVLLQKMDKIDQVVDKKPGLEISRDVLLEAFKIFA